MVLAYTFKLHGGIVSVQHVEVASGCNLQIGVLLVLSPWIIGTAILDSIIIPRINKIHSSLYNRIQCPVQHVMSNNEWDLEQGSN